MWFAKSLIRTFIRVFFHQVVCLTMAFPVLSMGVLAIRRNQVVELGFSASGPHSDLTTASSFLRIQDMQIFFAE
jgi:hypothetical protein